MITIVQNITGIHFSRNLPLLKIDANEVVNFQLFDADNALIYSDDLIPDVNNSIDLDLSTIVDDYSAFALPYYLMAQAYDISQFTWNINSGSFTGSFKAIRGKIEYFQQNTAYYLAHNFLTFHQGERITGAQFPEFLNYYASEVCDVIAMVNGIAYTLYTLTPNKLNVFDVCTTVIEDKVGFKVNAFSILITNGTTVLVQSVDYRVSRSKYTNAYLFFNGTGGIEVFTCTDVFAENSTTEFNIATIDDVRFEVDAIQQHISSQSCGLFLTENYNFIADFFASSDRFLISENAAIGIAMKEASHAKNNTSGIVKASFSFWKNTPNYKHAKYVVLAAPPYFSLLTAAYYLQQDNTWLDLFDRSIQATFENPAITFPVFSGNDVFDFTNRLFWKDSVETEIWYNPTNPRTCDVSFLTGLNIAIHGTDTTNNRLFLKDLDAFDNLHPTVFLYNRDLTSLEAKAVGNALNWYYVVFSNDGNYFETANNTIVTVKA